MHPSFFETAPDCFGTDKCSKQDACDECLFWDVCDDIDTRRIEEEQARDIAAVPCYGTDKCNEQTICDECGVWGLCHHRLLKNQQKEKVKDMNYQVQKTFSVCTAHRLMDHLGACKNLHGHNYNITVYLGSDDLDAQGMVVDFGDIKNKIGALIDEMYDHKTVLQEGDPLIGVLRPHLLFNLQIMPEAPTAENMARHTFTAIQQQMQHLCPAVKVMRIDVEETATSIAIYVE